jgi:hypothetical protein
MPIDPSQALVLLFAAHGLPEDLSGAGFCAYR